MLELTLFHLNVMYLKIKLTLSIFGWLIVNKCSTFDILMMVWKRYFVWENVWHQKYKNILFCVSKIEHPIFIDILLPLKVIGDFHLLYVSQVMQYICRIYNLSWQHVFSDQTRNKTIGSFSPDKPIKTANICLQFTFSFSNSCNVYLAFTNCHNWFTQHFYEVITKHITIYSFWPKNNTHCFKLDSHVAYSLSFIKFWSTLSLI